MAHLHPFFSTVNGGVPQKIVSVQTMLGTVGFISALAM
jgi:hypothetical protein